MLQNALRQSRRWLLTAVTLVGVLATLAGLAAARHHRGVYWSRVDVSFLIPYSSQNPNVIRTTSSSVVATAGAIGRTVDPSGGKKKLADQDVTLASEGIEHGSAVTLPNAGGQWSNSFAQPTLQVEAVGTTPGEVTARMTHLLSAIRVALADMQPSTEVARKNMITLLDSPSGPPPISFQAASRTRALAAILALGIAFTMLARTAVRRLPSARAEPIRSSDADDREPVRVGGSVPNAG